LSWGAVPGGGLRADAAGIPAGPACRRPQGSTARSVLWSCT